MANIKHVQGSRSTTIRLPTEIRQKIEAMAAANKQTISVVIIELLEKALRRK